MFPRTINCACRQGVLHGHNLQVLFQAAHPWLGSGHTRQGLQLPAGSGVEVAAEDRPLNE